MLISSLFAGIVGMYALIHRSLCTHVLKGLSQPSTVATALIVVVTLIFPVSILIIVLMGCGLGVWAYVGLNLKDEEDKTLITYKEEQS